MYHCFGCNAAGGPIDWMMQRRGMSFRQAVETLRAKLGLIAAPVVASSRTPATFTLAAEADRQILLRQVLDYYHATLKDSPEALAYLAKRGLQHPELIARFQLGYANGTLGYRLPDKQLKAGAKQRGQLQAIGLLRDSGHEHFNGSLVVPVIGTDGLAPAAKEKAVAVDEGLEPTRATPLPLAPVDDVAPPEGEHDLVLTFGDRRYRVRGWKKPLNPEALKINLLVSRGERFHVDTLDLYQAKARAAFTKQAGMELGEGRMC